MKIVGALLMMNNNSLLEVGDVIQIGGVLKN